MKVGKEVRMKKLKKGGYSEEGKERMKGEQGKKKQERKKIISIQRKESRKEKEKLYDENI